MREDARTAFGLGPSDSVDWKLYAESTTDCPSPPQAVCVASSTLST
jgi:hypothetical protein